LAGLDFEYHSRAPGFDTTQVLREVTDATDPYFPWVPGTHFQSSFNHIASGYDAGYYGYQWALALSRDVLTRFQQHGFLDPETDHAWRDVVLANGGGIDEKEMVTKFLGRPPSEDAYGAFLRGE